MSWEPISKSLGTVIDERLSSPLTSSFAIAWALWNYKVFFILFSARSLEYKFDEVHERFAGMDFLVNGFGIPLIFAILYIYALPLPAQAAYRVWRENQKKTEDIRLEYEDQKLLTNEESRAYRARHREMENQVDALQKESEQQKSDLKKADAENKNLLEKAALGVEVEQVRGEFKNLRAQLDVVNTSLEHEVQLKKTAEREIARLKRELAEANDRAPGSAQAGFPLVFDAPPVANKVAEALSDDGSTDPLNKLAELLKVADDKASPKRDNTSSDGSIRLITENLESNWRDLPSDVAYANVAEELWRKSQSSGVDSITHGEIPPGLLMAGLHQIWRLSGDFGHNELTALRTLPPNTESPLAEICNMLEALIPQRDIARLLERLAREKFVYIDEHGHSIIRVGKGNLLVQSSNLLAAAYKAASTKTQ